MINDIHIKNEASFGEDTQSITGLKKINFFYGANGSGKTTISRVISDESRHDDCSISWENGNKLKTFVYNRDFVDLNFNPDEELKGVFTLGEDNDAVIEGIKKAKGELDTIDKEIKKIKKTLKGEDGNGGKRAKLEKLENDFKDECWKYKTKYEGDFKNAFKGDLTKEKFKTRILKEMEENKATLFYFDELKEKAETIFADDLTKEELIPPVQYDDLIALAGAEILSKKVIGKDDVDIATMIKKLGNSDWVKQGRVYYDKNDEHCPFCQQKIDVAFTNSLEEYFNEVYLNDMATIDTLITNYNEFSDFIMQRIDGILSADPKHLDREKFQAHKEVLETRIRANKQHIARKKKEASTIVTLESLQGVLVEVSAEITSANDEIKKHNDVIDNIKKEKQILISQIWRFIIDEIKSTYDTYNINKKKINAAIANIKSAVEDLEGQARTKSTDIRDLESQVTSIQPTIDAINSLLKSFGFMGFSLAQSDQKGFYKIIRPNGEDVKETLSEGEKTFITFLYFYHLLKGSDTESGITEDRVVVFDDPVSSLDSDILFIVSHLIKGLFKEVRKNTGYIKQVMVFTHNIYFHKEISFQAQENEPFWIIRKDNNYSIVEPHKTNPIKNSYELLWQEVGNSDRSKSTIRNTLRRILEHYFKILGGIKIDEIANEFEGKDKIICGILLSWVHDGSHNADEDLYISCDDETVDKYLDVFKEMFKKSGHIDHYNMMIGTSNNNEANNIVKLPEVA